MSKLKQKRPMSYETKKGIIGYAFIAPWIFGFIYLMVLPLINSLIYSFSDVTLQVGYVDTVFVGFQNYRDAINDAKFLPAMWSTFSTVLLQTPLLVIFSLMMAIMLNQEFKGRTAFRAVFFLPVIIAGSLVMDTITGSTMMGALMSGNVGNGGLFQSDFISEVLKETNLPADVINIINTLVNDIFNLTWQSGIQILIFLAALQSVEGTLYEVAKVEGATAWETFWKVTFPMIMPMLTLNLLYTFIDNYTSYSSDVFKLVQEYSEKVMIDYSAAMAWMNFIVVFIVVMIVYVVLNRKSRV
ncbi:MAG: sugar ABC transporter permease [Clostridia bacterium]|nr:sugar ABC transporter permease [Clostridia bacterium]